MTRYVKIDERLFDTSGTFCEQYRVSLAATVTLETLGPDKKEAWKRLIAITQRDNILRQFYL